MLIQPRLMPIFSLAAAVMISVVLLAGMALQQISQQQQSLTAWYNSIVELERQIQTLEQLASHYKANAPRDYDSYNRDVLVFYQQFLQAIQGLDDTAKTQQSLQPSADSVLLGLPLISDPADANALAHTWQLQWQQ